MSMSIQVTKNMLNLAEIQEKLNHVVFDYVDTTQKWDKAQENLQHLHSLIVEHFEQHIRHNDGTLPNGNSYWVLFLDLASRLVYFNNLVKQNIDVNLEETTRNEIAAAYEMAAKILPYKNLEDNDEFLEEIEKSLQQVTNENRLIDKTSYPISQCMEHFQQYVKKLY